MLINEMPALLLEFNSAIWDLSQLFLNGTGY